MEKPKRAVTQFVRMSLLWVNDLLTQPLFDFLIQRPRTTDQ